MGSPYELIPDLRLQLYAVNLPIQMNTIGVSSFGVRGRGQNRTKYHVPQLEKQPLVSVDHALLHPSVPDLTSFVD